jgi:hypothetical protein
VSDIDFTLREELSALLDGVLPEERAVELRRHLESDAALRKEYEELRRTIAAVRALPRPSAPPELRARLEQKLMAPPATGIRRLRFRLAVAAVVTLAVGAGVLALRPSHPQPVHEEARKPDSIRAMETGAPPSAQPPAGLGDAPAKQVEAEAESVDERLGRDLREPVAVPSPPEAPAEEKETFREDAAAARSAKAKRMAQDDITIPELEGVRKGAARDAEQKGAAPTLLALAVQARVEPETRMPYLSELNRLNSEKLEAHLNELRATLVAARAMSTALPPSANLTVTDADEARQVFSVLNKFTRNAGRGVQATIRLPGRGGGPPLLTAEVEVTPQQWQSVGNWLQLMDMTDARTRPPITVEEGRSRDPQKKKARAKAESKDREARPLDALDRDAKRKVKIFIRYPRPEPRAARAEEK